ISLNRGRSATGDEVNRPYQSFANKYLPSAVPGQTDQTFLRPPPLPRVQCLRENVDLVLPRTARAQALYRRVQARARRSRRARSLREFRHAGSRILVARSPLLPTLNLEFLPDFRHEQF